MTTESRRAKKAKYEKKIELVYPEWERQDRETLQSFEAFKIYRDLGLIRSYTAVTKKLLPPETTNYKGKYQVVLAWSYRYRWVERVSAYQRYMDSVFLQEKETAVKEMVHRHAEYAKQTMQSLYVPVVEFGRKYNLINEMRKTALRNNIPFNDDSSDLDHMTLSQLLTLVQKSAPLISAMADMERKSRGEPTEITANDVTSGGQVIKPDIKVVVNGTHSTIMKEYENKL